MKRIRSACLFAAFTAALVWLVACASLNPGADAFVVRVEQAQTAAGATFDLVLRVDNSDRGFWRTNAPAFHQFCEWLRTPQKMQGSNVARAVALQLNVDDLKFAYKQSNTTGNSNALWTAFRVLSAVISQADSWQVIIEAPTYH